MNTPSCSTSRTCLCDPRFSRPLGFVPGEETPAAFACLRCGALTWAGGDDTLTPESADWLSRWPRLLVDVEGDFACLPAAVRCANILALESAHHTAWDAQRHLPRGRRLRRAGCPKAPPPDSLPSSLSHYRLLWEASAFSPQTDLDVLLYWSDPAHTLVSPFARDALLRRTDLQRLLPGLVFSSIPRRRLALCTLATEAPSLMPSLVPLLRTWLSQTETNADNPRARGQAEEAARCRNALLAWQTGHVVLATAALHQPTGLAVA